MMTEVNILGAGPSLFYVDSKKLDRRDCIYVNSAGMLLPSKCKNKTWLSVDRMCLKWSYFWDYVGKSDCEKMCSSDFRKFESHLTKFSVRFFETCKEFEVGNEKLCGVSSIIAAVNLAMNRGYEKIFLFGVDHRFLQGKSHFWEFYPLAKRPVFSGGANVGKAEQKKKFLENMKFWKRIKEIAEKKGVEIINCSKRTTALDIFQKVDTKEGLQ